MPDYVVQPGDSLYKIAQRTKTTVEALMILNRLPSTALSVGQRLRIPVYTEAVVTVDTANIRSYASTSAPVIVQMERGAKMPVVASSGQWVQVRLYNRRTGWIARRLVNLVPHGGERPIQEILAFYTEEESPALPSSHPDFIAHVDQITDTALFHFRIDRENPTQTEKFFTFTDEYMRGVVTHGHRHNIRMLPVVHNLLYEQGKPTVNRDVIHGMLATTTTRRRFINHVVTLIQTYGYDGVHIDFEDVRYEDRDLLSAFYTELGREMRNRGYFFSVSTPARTSDDPTNRFSAPFDYAVIGAAADELVAMLYNEHGWPGSGPGPVVSIGWMEKVIRYALTKLPARKITAAVSVFGFDFNLTTKKNTYLTYTMAVNLARRYGKEIIFDDASQTPMFRYTDAAGNEHEVWFENAESIRAKLNLANRFGIRGLALWRLGMEDPAIWPMLERNFVARKSAL